MAKYGIKSSSGGGRSSARETIGTPFTLPPAWPTNRSYYHCAGRVAAAAIAEKWLKLRFGVEIVAWVRNRFLWVESDALTRRMCTGERDWRY